MRWGEAISSSNGNGQRTRSPSSHAADSRQRRASQRRAIRAEHQRRCDLRCTAAATTVSKIQPLNIQISRKMKNKVEEQTDKYYESMDPIYKIFLDHLKLDGTSYILEVDDTVLGVPVYLKYEGQKTSSCNKPRSKSLKKAKRKESVHIAPLVEESYERFFNNLKFEGELLILDLGGGRNIIYEEDRINIFENVTDENGVGPDEQALVPHIRASGSNGEKNELTVIAADSRTFDEKLAAVVRKPFDQHEYEALMNEAIRRKPVMKQRNLRNMSKRYHTHEAGLSYLDYYPDLATQIAEANNYKRLILLRKFFFWLENLCHDGAYMPWIPKSLTDRPVFNEELENCS